MRFLMDYVMPIVMAILIFTAVMVTAANFCPPEHLVDEWINRQVR